MQKRIEQNKPLRFFAQMARLYFRHHLSRSAAQLAYFLLLSVFPMLICVHALIGLVDGNAGAVLEWAAPLLPAGVHRLLADYLRYIQVDAPGLLTAGVVLTLGSGSAAFRAMMTAMEEMYGQPSHRGLEKVLVSLCYSVLLLVVVYASMVVLVTGNWFFNALREVLPRHFTLPRTSWPWLRFFLLFALMLLFILLVYRLCLPRKGTRPPVLPGALAAAVVLVGASWVFSQFFALSSRYSLVYGSLTSVMLLMVWLYLCGNILLLGNLVNRVLFSMGESRSDFRGNGPDSP